MNTGTIVLIIVLLVLVAAGVALYFVGKKAQKKQDEQREIMEANKQTVSMLIIDKKRMKIKDSGLHQSVIDQTPKYMRWSKLPIVKAKVGSQIATLLCDKNIYDNLPVKKTVKVELAGVYITSIIGFNLEDKKNKTFREKMSLWVRRTQEKAKDTLGK